MINKTKDTMAIIDFDNTLFETRRFWREHLFPSYEKIGIPRKDIESAFIKSTTVKVDYFIPELFIQELYSLKSCQHNKQVLEKIFNDKVYSPSVKKYYFPDAIRLINGIKKNSRAVLLSYGDKKFKNKFFKHCGINKHFGSQNIFVTTDKKIEVLNKLPKSSKYIIINDNYSETKNMVFWLQKANADTMAYLLDPNLDIKNESDRIVICQSIKEVCQKI